MTGWDYSEWTTISQNLYTQIKNLGWTILGVENPPTVSYTIGQEVGGGIVAYILQSGDNGYEVGKQKGLIVATADEAGENGYLRWNGSGTLIGGPSQALVSGASKTNTIVSALGPGTYAAKSCSDKVVGEFSDWYLPSLAELAKAFGYNFGSGAENKLSMSGLVYWSSSESNANASWASDSGFDTDRLKTSLLKVRAIRYFSNNL
jgi:hypothetical protein